MAVRALCIALFFLASAASAADKVVLWKRNYDTPFFLDVIKLAATLTEEDYGSLTIEPSIPLEQGRVFASLASGNLVNVAIAGISTEREKQGVPIYFPIDRGLLGFRVCLQTSQGQTYNRINTLNDLKEKQITVGLGTHWPDRKILESNGLRVMHSPVYEQLFSMLKAQRFDCFLRSFNEVQKELALPGNEQLRIESSLAIVYALADFIFVSIENARLHERLNIGLNKAYENGRFQKLFNQYFSTSLKLNRLYERKIIFLRNNDLSTPAMDSINRYGLASFPVHY